MQRITLAMTIQHIPTGHGVLSNDNNSNKNTQKEIAARRNVVVGELDVYYVRHNFSVYVYTSSCIGSEYLLYR